MKTSYDFAIKEVLKSEGGYSNDPADSGGETNFGITQRETSIPVRTMTVEQAKAIYKTKYWDAVNGDKLPAGVDYSVFDYGVNSGVGRSKKVLQQFKDKQGTELIDAINDERMAFLRNLVARRPKDQKFMKGWTSRVARVRSDSKILARGKDNTSGPVGGVVATVSLWTTFSTYIHAHPYLSGAAAVAVGALVWYIIHTIRNRK